MKSKNKFNVLVKNSKGYVWTSENGIFVKGYAFNSQGVLLQDDLFLNYFKEVSTKDQFVSKLANINGVFSVIINYNSKVLAAVDHVRTFPLFYYKKNDIFYITDYVDKSSTEFKIDTNSLNELTASGYCIGNTTLNKEISQLQAGQFLINENNKSDLDYYYSHKHSFSNKNTINTKLETIDKISINVFKRLKEIAKNKTVVIPLSGGYDSRYIAGLCKKLNFKNVICYTYGRKGSFEVNISKKVAEELHFEWHFVEYTKDKWQKSLNSKLIQEYTEYASNLSSLPIFQEVIAINELKNSGKIPGNAIFVPGFSGDMLGGSLLPKEFYFNNQKKIISKPLEKYIFDKSFSFITDKAIKKETINKIKNSLKNTTTQNITPDLFVSYFEDWFTQNRIGKYINNALRVYEFFGYKWAVPLWDKVLIEYWYTIPNTERIQAKLYNQYLFTKVFTPLNIGFKKPDEIVPSKFRTFIKKMVPKKIIKPLININLKLKGKSHLVNLNSTEELSSIITDAFLKDGIILPKNLHVNSLRALFVLHYNLNIHIEKLFCK